MLLAVGLLVRSALSFWTGSPFDFEIFIRVGYFVANGTSPTLSRYPYVTGLGQPIYPYVSGLGYLPAWGLCLGFAFKVYEIFPFSPYFYYFLIKLLPILADLASAYVIYLLVLNFRGNVEKAEKASLILFLCPFVVFLSSIWGMFDSIPIFFTLLSLLLMLSDRTCWSAVSLGLGIYFKVMPIIYLPIQLFFISRKKGLKETTAFLLVALTVPFLLTLIPLVFFRWPVSETAVTVLSQTDKVGEGLSYWNFGSFLKDLFPNMFTQESINSFFGFPLIRYLWILGLLSGYLLYYECQQNSSKDQTADLDLLLAGFSITTIGFLLTRTFIPEQFVLYLLSTMVILSSTSIQTYFKRVWIIALTFVFVNLYPFAFAYLINMNLFSVFNYLATTQPFSTVRYATRFIIAVLFDYTLLGLVSTMVRKHEKSIQRNEEQKDTIHDNCMDTAR
jgi:hypothetical protein